MAAWWGTEVVRMQSQGMEPIVVVACVEESVGAFVGTIVGVPVGASVGVSDGASVGTFEVAVDVVLVLAAELVVAFVLTV